MNDLSDIAHIIQLAVAPAFLLVGIGSILSVVTMRLGRTVDRARQLEDSLQSDTDEKGNSRMRAELVVLDRRMVFCQRAIGLSTISVLFVCFVIAALFVGVLANIDVAAVVAVLFVAAMASLIAGLLMFLVEVTLATRMLRVRAELLMMD